MRLSWWLVGGLLFGLPLGWMCVALLSGAVWAWDGYRTGLLLRTVGLTVGVVAVAAVFAWPVARVIGVASGWPRAVVLLFAPATLVLPTLVHAYGVGQAIRLSGVMLEPGSAGDVLRCVMTLGGWLWPAVAVPLGLAWRRLDAGVLQAAELDGARGRVAARMLAAPALAGVLVAAALALPEFSVYEPTGISVLATEVRLVFDTGAFAGQVVAEGGQAARAGAALSVALPGIVLTLGFGLVGAWLVRRVLPAQLEPPEMAKPIPAGWWTWAGVAVTFGLTLVVPLVALVLSLRSPLWAGELLSAYSRHLGGSLLLAGLAGAGGVGLGLLASVWRPGVWVWVGLTSFLVGGLLTGIALIRIYDRPITGAVYDSGAVAVLAYLGRFGFLPMLVGAATFSPTYARLREMARADGAGSLATAVYAVMPAAWPMLVAAGLGVALLALGEVPATVLLAPQRPPTLIPLLMTWVHMQRYDPMIQVSLLLAGVLLLGGMVATGLLLGARAGVLGSWAGMLGVGRGRR
jgi:iron(III) transport system permease protein